MTPRDCFRLAGLLTVLEGAALAAGGRQAIRLGQCLTPPWYALWLRPLGAAPLPLLRLLGVAEVGLGLRILAMAPPSSRIVANLALATLEPFRALWRVSVGHAAEQAFEAALPELVPPGARVLDLGCGTGDNLALLLLHHLPFGSYLGVDCSCGLLAQARARFADLPKVDFSRNDLLNEQLPTGEFDLILAIWALDRLPDPFGLMVRALRQLRHGGHAILLFVSPVNDWRAGLVHLAASLTGRQLWPASIYTGLPSLAGVEQFAGDLITFTILAKARPGELSEGSADDFAPHLP